MTRDQNPRRNLMENIRWINDISSAFLKKHKRGTGLTNHIEQKFREELDYIPISKETIWEYLRFARDLDKYGYLDIAEKEDWSADKIRSFRKFCKEGNIRPKINQLPDMISSIPTILHTTTDIKEITVVEDHKDDKYWDPIPVDIKNEMMSEFNKIFHNKKEWEDAKKKRDNAAIPK